MHDREGLIRTRLADITGPEPGDSERQLIGRLLRSYLTKTQPGADHLGELMRGGTPEEVRDHAHSLKGSAANLGADTLAAIFAEVETSARGGVILDPDITLGRVCCELALVQDVMERLEKEFV